MTKQNALLTAESLTTHVLTLNIYFEVRSYDNQPLLVPFPKLLRFVRGAVRSQGGVSTHRLR